LNAPAPPLRPGRWMKPQRRRDRANELAGGHVGARHHVAHHRWPASDPRRTQGIVTLEQPS
jgi:hypothetical protein